MASDFSLYLTCWGEVSESRNEGISLKIILSLSLSLSLSRNIYLEFHPSFESRNELFSSAQSMDPNGLLPREEIERMIFFESAREKAAADYARSPLDSENLTKWGGVLLELAHFRQGQSAIDMIEEAISKFEEALKSDPKRHDTLWCLGNAYTSEGFLLTDSTKAYSLFRQATQCFQKALDEDQDNQLYLKALEMSLKAPSLYHELQKQLASQQATSGSGSGSTSGGFSKGSKKKKNSSDLKYDVLGWIVLAMGIVAWVGMAKSSMPPPPPVT